MQFELALNRAYKPPCWAQCQAGHNVRLLLAGGLQPDKAWGYIPLCHFCSCPTAQAVQLPHFACTTFRSQLKRAG